MREVRCYNSRKQQYGKPLLGVCSVFQNSEKAPGIRDGLDAATAHHVDREMVNGANVVATLVVDPRPLDPIALDGGMLGRAGLRGFLVVPHVDPPMRLARQP